MKYMIMCMIALVVCLGIAGILAYSIGRIKKLRKITTVFIAMALSILMIVVGALGYLEVYYPADASADITSSDVLMQEIPGGYFFDGPGEDSALIFYPGAKVATMAYAPLMTALAEQGVDCFLADLPFRMAIFGRNQADQFLENYDYENWSVAGHSMGGLVVSGYAADHADRIDHLILLASFPGSEIPDDIALCSIYGTCDGCLSMDSYEGAKQYWPDVAEEYVIEGGNHAQFANYGPQSDDMEAEISREEQQEQTVEIILHALSNKS